MKQLDIGTYEVLYALLIDQDYGSAIRDVRVIRVFNTMPHVPIHRDMHREVYRKYFNTNKY